MDFNRDHQSSHVVVLGINHTSSTVDLRDRLLFRDEQLNDALRQLSQIHGVHESLILSTCNRIELYVVVGNLSGVRESLLKFISDFHSIPVGDFDSHTYFFSSLQAVEHLYLVISSLDSLVIGECQILSQVKTAYKSACEIGTVGLILHKLFHYAITAGKRIRSETKISEGIVSIASVAVDLARKIVGRLDQSTALIIGAGEMSKLTVQHLTGAGIKRLYCANRTRESAMEMAAQFNGIPVSLEELPSVFNECDIVISSTGAPHFIVTVDTVSHLMAKRKNRPVFLIDIAAPRDIDPDVGKLFNVFLYSIDNLTLASNENTRLRQNEISNVKRIIDEEMSKYNEWYASLKVIPTLVTLRNNFEAIRDKELKRYSSELAGLSEPVKNIIHQFASSLTDKFLHTPFRVLREKSTEDDALMFADVVSDLFDLRKNDEK